MTEIFSRLSDYFSYAFVRNAMIVGVLIALCASLFGVVLVLKRFSFIGDGLSHVAFGAMAIATVVGVSNSVAVVLPITMLAAVLILKTGENKKLNGDAVIAIISVSALSVGYLLMNLFSASPNVSGDVCSTLFGSTSILTLTSLDVWICIVMSVIVLLAFVLFYNRIFATTFDEGFASAGGLHTNTFNLILALVVSVIIVLAMNLVGSLLISALVIFPAITAMRIFKTFKGVVVCSAIISVFCASLGIVVAILASTPVGATIVTVQIFTFLVFGSLPFLKER